MHRVLRLEQAQRGCHDRHAVERKLRDVANRSSLEIGHFPKRGLVSQEVGHVARQLRLALERLQRARRKRRDDLTEETRARWIAIEIRDERTRYAGIAERGASARQRELNLAQLTIARELAIQEPAFAISERAQRSLRRLCLNTDLEDCALDVDQRHADPVVARS
jgi:hypothetical protein